MTIGEKHESSFFIAMKGEHMQEKRNEQNTSEEVIVHFNDKSRETMQDKLKRIMLRELRRKSNEKKDEFD